MWPDRISSLGPLTYESGALPTALHGPAQFYANVQADLNIYSTNIVLGHLTHIKNDVGFFLQKIALTDRMLNHVPIRRLVPSQPESWQSAILKL